METYYGHTYFLASGGRSVGSGHSLPILHSYCALDAHTLAD